MFHGVNGDVLQGRARGTTLRRVIVVNAIGGTR